jgi:predicted O-methyltransferase YrrM
MRKSIEFIKEKFKDKPLIGVEIGVENGLHSIEINASLNMEELYLIDIWEEYIQEGTKWNYEPQYWNVKLKFKDCSNIKVIKGDSIIVASQFKDEILDFIYIDGNHQKEYVKKDIETWYKKIKIGGVICGHDYDEKWKGVIQAVNEFVKENNLKLNFKQNDDTSTDWWIEKI